jgi:hypothetical protein
VYNREYIHRVKISWTLGQDTEEWWNEVCAWAIEEFGLPGDKFVSNPQPHYMVFDFKDKEDAAIMALRWGNK